MTNLLRTTYWGGKKQKQPPTLHLLICRGNGVLIRYRKEFLRALSALQDVYVCIQQYVSCNLG